ncbi:MAG: hypothetical protein ACR2KI_02030 [Candidatus Limnocylindria bacterium]|nr:MAG: hypothetical protein DLM71_07590 [Chloroflexota bacterium]
MKRLKALLNQLATSQQGLSCSTCRSEATAWTYVSGVTAQGEPYVDGVAVCESHRRQLASVAG